jgi:lipoprotein
MKTIIIMTIFIITISCIKQNTNYIQINEEYIDFKTLKRDSSLIKTIYIKNTYPDTIHVDTITTSCECVTMIRKIKKIPPHQKDSIIFKFKAEETGYISRGLSILFKDRQEPFQIIIEGEII